TDSRKGCPDRDDDEAAGDAAPARAHPRSARSRRRGRPSTAIAVKTMARLSHARRPHVEVSSRQRRGPSRAELAIIEAASRTRIMPSSIDGWLARQPSLIDRRRPALLPVLKERGATGGLPRPAPAG